tara:strand:- start:3487 stop:4128 length:642 start_codon:yes stop_codon:yes gene_type:complete
MAYEGGYTGEKTGYTGPGIPDITRVTNPRQPDTNNYLSSNYFKLEITRLPLVTYHCQSANLPSLSLTPTEQTNPTGTPIKWVGGRYIWEDFTVSFVVDEDMKNWIEVFEWMEDIAIMTDNKRTMNYELNSSGYEFHRTGRSSPGQLGDYFSNASLIITNSSYKPKLTVHITDMFPTALSGIQFNSTNSDNEPIIATATFAYTYYTINRLTNDA